jgi:hypothetical protein
MGCSVSSPSAEPKPVEADSSPPPSPCTATQSLPHLADPAGVVKRATRTRDCDDGELSAQQESSLGSFVVGSEQLLELLGQGGVQKEHVSPAQRVAEPG